MKNNNDIIFKAIADPTRRKIFHMLIMANIALNYKEIAEHFSSSRQAISKHIRILEESGLVDTIEKGREKYCYADPKPLLGIYDWVNFYKQFWDNKLKSLDAFLDEDN